MTGPSESLESFLEKLNRARAVKDVFESEDKVSTVFDRQGLSNFQVELEKGESVYSNHLNTGQVLYSNGSVLNYHRWGPRLFE